MIYLILDTNNWIYLANGLDPISNKHHDALHYELLRSLKELKDKKLAQVIINDIIITEWNRNKEHCKAKIKKLEQKLADKENAFKEIEKYTKGDLKQLKEEFIQGIEEEIRLNATHIQKVEDFIFNDCEKVEVSQEVKLKIFELSINNQAPFHNKKNNVGDAAILLSAVEYLKSQQDRFGFQAFFISNNIEEYTDGKNAKEFHPKLIPLLNGVKVQFERVLPAALNISKKVIIEMEQFAIKLTESAADVFTWDLDIQENGVAMYLNVLYHNKYKRQGDWLTVCVGKKTGQNRPEFISLILPKDLNKENGVFLFFTKNEIDSTTYEYKMNPDERATIRMRFASETENEITARIREGYVQNEKSGIISDVFQSFLEFDTMLVKYINDNLSIQTITVPLHSFRKQYFLLP
ncbi:PIN domain-containing protein [Longitalea luteola]|uniref:PIN domain-containing protein n=1 Tax=Longitalea luteola TaxID=2812563 RepID=UPI001A957D8B|nr:PIN domain-containing protein [Longitalea luteola]